MMILQQTRGGLSSGDQLALDLPFAVTKSLTARIGPTPTFTRASAASFIGSDGLIQSATTNTPRFDHDPVTLACRGLLMEEGRTNLVFPSATLSTQTRTVTAVAHTLSFYGSGTIVLSGTHSATVVGTGAYPARRTLTFTPTAGSITLTVTGTVEFAQLETGSFPTSYIPTTTASVVRSADVCSITGSNFTSLWNGSEISVLFKGVRQSAATGNYWSLTSGTLAQSITSDRGLTTERMAAAGGGIITFIGLGANQSIRTAHAIKQGDYAGSLNGSAAGISSSAHVPAFTTFQIGMAHSGTIAGATWISEIKVYKKRLPNAKLQSLTV